MIEKIISRGAEAVIIQAGSNIIKKRIPKSYRFPELDEKIRKQRTKKEAKLIQKANELIPSPKLISSPLNFPSTTDNYSLSIEFLKGKKLSEHLEESNYKKICNQIGKNIAKLHDAGIIHGDLTTSNMIYVEENDEKYNKPTFNNYKKNKIKYSNDKLQSNDFTNDNIKDMRNELADTAHEAGKVYFIDFGLGFHSNRIEDKAVDLHLIKQALEAKHSSIYETAFKSILQGYKTSKNYSATIKQLEKVEKRGRYKAQY